MFPLFFALGLGADPVAASGPTLHLPPSIQAQPGKHFTVKAETNCKWTRWTIPAGLERVPPVDTAYGEHGFVGYGPAGSYEFKIEGTLNDQYVDGKCIVTIGVGPGPGPQPDPGDALAVLLQKLYDADKSPKKAEQRQHLIELWSSAALQFEGNPSLTTVKQFREAMHAQAGAFPFFLDDAALVACRARLAEELKVLCADENCKLGEPRSELRQKGKALLDRFAAAMGSVK